MTYDRPYPTENMTHSGSYLISVPRLRESLYLWSVILYKCQNCGGQNITKSVFSAHGIVVNPKAGLSHRYNNFSPWVYFLKMPEGFNSFVQRIAPIDYRDDLPKFKEFLHIGQIVLALY